MKPEAMRSFWEARAREDPFFFVDNRLDYRAADLDQFWAGGREGLDLMLELLGVQVAPEDEIVEVGCGVGRITRVLAERATSVRAVDVSTRMLELARELNPGLTNVTWLHGDGTSLGAVQTSSATVCISLVVFQHIPDPRITLGYVREMGRVLAPGGWAAFQVSNAPEVHRQRGVAERLRLRATAMLGRGPKGQQHPAWRGSAVKIPDLRSVAAEAGLRVDRIIGEGSMFCFVKLTKPADTATPAR